jgi:membrane protein
VGPVSNPGTSTEPPAPQAGTVIDVSDAPSPATSKWYLLRHQGAALIRYLLDSEVHTFAFSVAANAILSFVPFVMLLYTLTEHVFRSQAMTGVVNDMVISFFPAATSTSDWLVKNLGIYVDHSSRHGVQALSLVMILIACTGIFLPLEVALNQAWGVRKSRNYLVNQTLALGLAVWMAVLGMSAVLLSAGQRAVLGFLFFHHTDNFFYNGISDAWLALCSSAACIVFFFSIYWILPNCKVPARPVMRASIITGLVWLAAKYIFVWILPHLDLKSLYGPFFVSVGLLLWAYISGLILFAGAQFSVARIKPVPHENT